MNPKEGSGSGRFPRTGWGKVAFGVILWAALAVLGILVIIFAILYPAIVGVQHVEAWLDDRNIPAALGFAVLVPGVVVGLLCLWLGRRRWLKVAGCFLGLVCAALLQAVW